MRYDISIIIPTCRPKQLAHVLNQIKMQSADGITYEVVIIQESDTGYDEFNTLRCTPNMVIKRQKIQGDNGASARDLGVISASGTYVAFWDDDNIYYPHAIATLFAVAGSGHVGQPKNVGIVRIRHQGLTIPMSHIKPGEIDTMCFCVKRELAAKVKWDDAGGRYNDYRWITAILETVKGKNAVWYSSIVIGEKL